MGATAAYIDLAFQGRLRSGDELFQAEILLFRDLIEDFGDVAFDVPGYSLIQTLDYDRDGQLRWVNVLLKVRGVWSQIFVEVRQPSVLVLFDHRRV